MKFTNRYEFFKQHLLNHGKAFVLVDCGSKVTSPGLKILIC